MNLFWFRKDLRLTDNPALYEATKRGKVIAVYIQDDITPGKWKSGAASRWWLHHSLQVLKKSIESHGGHLYFYKGEAKKLLPEIAQQINAKTVYWNREYEPYAIEEEDQLKDTLRKLSVDTRIYNGRLLLDPEQIKNKQGSYFKVFTPFWKCCLAEDGVNAPLGIAKVARLVKSSELRLQDVSLDELNLLPKGHNWATKFYGLWAHGEQSATNCLEQFIANRLNCYAIGRDYPSEDATSTLSAYLHFGEISPRQIWSAIQSYKTETKDTVNADKFLSELGWREFSNYLLYHCPTLPEEAFNPTFNHFPWQENKALLTAWQEGKTGYPLIDAGMRELWQTGYMHNRIRMAVASFLTKHLLIHWQVGAKWFWDTLVDADLANNTCGWQWVSGCGADAAPYFRIFNPIIQSEKFDPESIYIKRWVPELREFSGKAIHRPWECVNVIGKKYPAPIVDHKLARERALEAYQQVKKGHA
ncbi:MAG: deoxyribodipyrimidine photolyase [Verrucomicrobia bacterium CG_4_10_14_3_um_filter_43_23]|nr:MAG: hypothetical protein AUJ82_06545 [Verrucomicrobia bacterium CG1_02_43_26]PIP59793.1 MAG: deoxyribodipyrimidine photolyase [Verrucomicrobia bacterium CG22_combo_CG10-13_8_21_14_all_43_17]PIX57800.1 MAG: deoxyribodipyrimidine photolyase [Verrucomicrobia bacterium CG_4_10_14_3_um_filter_43_23]PIY60898.1 MAG: deoxyribodipyrimidine photolyase [Verrucomicrobia bacterium CG_4_10_14_0_8_um_filter_43_34]PJA43497.1 MAG: deoxyribodipyrimidine photolyase [Verrucomicrobia bacterium CG_4_9_14_3_um_fi